MGLFQSAKSRFLLKVSEENIYGMIVNEMANGQISQGLYAKALASANGDEQQTKATYIKLRADMMKAELAAMVELSQDLKSTEARARKAQALSQKGITELNMSRWLAGVFVLIGLMLIFADKLVLGMCFMVFFSLIWILLSKKIKQR